MNDINLAVVRSTVIWNGIDPGRRDLIAWTWTEDASYCDPLLTGDGPDGIDAMVGAFQGGYPDRRFRRTGGADAHHDRVRFGWQLVGPEGQAPLVRGVDVGVVASAACTRPPASSTPPPSPRKGNDRGANLERAAPGVERRLERPPPRSSSTPLAAALSASFGRAATIGGFARLAARGSWGP